MTLLRRLPLVFLILITVFLVSAHSIKGHHLLAIAAGITGAVWGYALYRKWHKLIPCCFLVLFSMTVHSVFIDVPAVLAAVSVLLLIFSWDLNSLGARLQLIENGDRQIRIIRHHMNQLFILTGLTAIALSASLLLAFTIRSVWTFGLFLIAVSGLSGLFLVTKKRTRIAGKSGG